MTEFINLLITTLGEKQQLRYCEMIDILVDVNGVEMERIYDLTLVEADNYEPGQAIHALNTMIIDSCNQYLMTTSVFLDTEEFTEESLHLIFAIFEGVLRMDGWELHDDLLAIIDNEELDNEDKFFDLLNEVIDVEAVYVLPLIESVEDVFFEVLEEEILFNKKQLENSFPLEEHELTVYKVDEWVKAVLKTCSHTCVPNEYLIAKKTFPVPLSTEFIDSLHVLPIPELIKSLAITTLMQYSEIRDSTTLLSKSMENAVLLNLPFSQTVGLSVGMKALFKRLEEKYG